MRNKIIHPDAGLKNMVEIQKYYWEGQESAQVIFYSFLLKNVAQEEKENTESISGIAKKDFLKLFDHATLFCEDKGLARDVFCFMRIGTICLVGILQT